MSKKANTNVIEVAANAKKQIAIVNGEDLRLKMEAYPNVSLRKLALALEVSYGSILKASKAPIAGIPYDPENTNWDEVATAFAKRNKNFMEANWEELNESSNVPGMVSKDLEGWLVGDLMYLRRNATVPYEIVYKTDTHMVLQLIGTTEPMVWAHGTVLLNGPSRVARTEKK